MNPVIHSENSVKKWGGCVEDYLPIHEYLDQSKNVCADNRHRALTHTHFFINTALLPKFGSYIKIQTSNNKFKKVSVKDIAEKHIFEDFGFIPTPMDFLGEMEIKPWMNRAKKGIKLPPSLNKTKTKEFYESTKRKTTRNIKKDTNLSRANKTHKQKKVSNYWRRIKEIIKKRRRSLLQRFYGIQ